MLRQSALLRCPVLRHRIKRVPGSFLRAEILYPGAAMEDDMADGLAVDTMLWLIIFGGAAFVWLGCHMTAGGEKQADRYDGRFGH